MNKKSRKPMEYKIIKNATSADLAQMDADGWRREHTQFRPDGVLDCIFSRVKLEEKTPTPPMKIETVIFPPVGGADVLDTRVGLFDHRHGDKVPMNKLKRIAEQFGDVMDTDAIIAQSNQRIIQAGVDAFNRTIAELRSTQDVSELKVGA